MAGSRETQNLPRPDRPTHEKNRVLIVTMLGQKATVGISTHVGQVADTLAANGHPTRVVTPQSASTPTGRALLVPDRVLVAGGSERAVGVARFLRRRSLERALRRDLRIDVPTLVYAQDPRSAYAALKLRPTPDLPVVMVVHYNESQAEELVERQMISRGRYTYRSIRAFEADVLSRIDGLVFVSEYMRQQLEEQVPHTRGIPSVVIPNFLADVSPVDAEGQLADCISVGSLVERKNHAYLLHVMAEARRLGHTFSLTLVGDGPLRRDLQQLARDLHITDLVTFTGKNYAVEQLLPRHRVYVHSSLMDNCPFALIEAFRAGLPVIAGPVGGIPELLGDTGASRAWDLADPVAGAAVLTSLLSDKLQLDKAASMARREFETKYCAAVTGQQLVRFLNEVADQSRS